jgi:hypothetical protein
MGNGPGVPGRARSVTHETSGLAHIIHEKLVNNVGRGERITLVNNPR